MEWYYAPLLIVVPCIFFFTIGMPISFAFLATMLSSSISSMGIKVGPYQTIHSLFDSIATFSLTPIPLFVLMGEIHDPFGPGGPERRRRLQAARQGAGALEHCRQPRRRPLRHAERVHHGLHRRAGGHPVAGDAQKGLLQGFDPRSHHGRRRPGHDHPAQQHRRHLRHHQRGSGGQAAHRRFYPRLDDGLQLHRDDLHYHQAPARFGPALRG